MPYEVPNDVIMHHEKRIEWNILISSCMPYYSCWDLLSFRTQSPKYFYSSLVIHLKAHLRAYVHSLSTLYSRCQNHLSLSRILTSDTTFKSKHLFCARLDILLFRVVSHIHRTIIFSVLSNLCILSVYIVHVSLPCTVILYTCTSFINRFLFTSIFLLSCTHLDYLRTDISSIDQASLFYLTLILFVLFDLYVSMNKYSH